MPEQYHTLGSALEANKALCIQPVKKVVAAVERSRCFEHKEDRKLLCDKKGEAAVIVVDCLNHKVPSRNQYGIKNRERLALVFYRNPEIAPETRALRKNFPTGIHQNPTNEDEAVSICLYEEPWTSTRRHWTATAHLKQILLWLEHASRGDLHQEEQVLEPFFFACGMKLVLPPDFEKGMLDRQRQLALFGDGSSILAVWKDDTPASGLNRERNFVPLVTELAPAEHSAIEQLPLTLGGLEKVLHNRGGNLLDGLKEQIQARAPVEGLTMQTNQKVLLIVRIPLCRGVGQQVERTQAVGFLVVSDLCSLGVALDVLRHDTEKGRFFKFQLLGAEGNPDLTEWQSIELMPIDITTANTIEFARSASAINENTANFTGILAGVGALGSSLAGLWALEGWGQWTYVDNDKIETHNILRHTAKYADTGMNKVHAVAQEVSYNYYPGYFSPSAIPDSILNFGNTDVTKAITQADLLVDASTTLEVPREIALRDDAPRSMSAFFTPNGFDSVLLVEDKNRGIRLDSLEAQYYRAILENDWGSTHLKKHKGDMWVGNGCRDVSTIISTELVQLHSAMLARKVRLMRDQRDALIYIGHFADETGVSICEIEPETSMSFSVPDWTIVLDSGVIKDLQDMRVQKLPDETGGVLLGFIDHKTYRIYIVKALAAPFDSKETVNSFVRGTNGLLDILNEARRRTAGIVSYLGEWHSHPPGCGAIPSCLDIQLINYLGKQLAEDEQPALMAIIGENEISFMLKSEF